MGAQPPACCRLCCRSLAGFFTMEMQALQECMQVSAPFHALRACCPRRQMPGLLATLFMPCLPTHARVA